MPRQTKKQELDLVLRELSLMQDLFSRIVGIIPRFDITNPKILPYGLKPHTRSVSWILEQVIVQQAKYNHKSLHISDVSFDLPDTSLHDCEIHDLNGGRYFVNIKVTNTGTRSHGKNDIAAVEKLFMQYTANPTYRIVYAVFPFSFKNTRITFVTDGVHTFSPQFLPIYVNPRNDKLQASYFSRHELRTRAKFLQELRNNSKSIVL